MRDEFTTAERDRYAKLIAAIEIVASINGDTAGALLMLHGADDARALLDLGGTAALQRSSLGREHDCTAVSLRYKRVDVHAFGPVSMMFADADPFASIPAPAWDVGGEG